MGSYGRNFEFRIVPESENRLGRFSTPSTGTFVLGSPVAGAGTFDDLGREVIVQASAATPPVKGRHGILVYEHGDGGTWAGDDPFLTTYSDKGTAPLSKAVQVVSGPNVKVVLRNVAAQTFLNTRTYPARNMVTAASIGATPTLSVGEYLEPATTPNDTNGYWQEAGATANAWLVISKVDLDRLEVEAVFLF